MVTVKDLIQYRMRNECLVTRLATTTIPTAYGGEFTAIAFGNLVDDSLHIALVKGNISPDEDILVRVHPNVLPAMSLPQRDATAGSNCTKPWRL